MTTTLEAKYQTPVGGFNTWEEAATACERCDLDPCTCIVYTGSTSSKEIAVDFDEDSQLWGVYNLATGFCYSTFCSKEEALGAL